MFTFVDAALVRANTWTMPDDLPWPDLGDDPDTDPAELTREWRRWLRRVWAWQEFASALELASPSLARELRAVSEGAQPRERELRRVVTAVVKYLIRATTRATPFGLFAGVAPVQLAHAAEVGLGSSQHPVARVDAEWLDGVITRLENYPDLRARLLVVVNSLAFVRDDRLVISCQRQPADRSEDAAGSVAEVSVR
ncbi:MAG TPA: lantibiotic dehydratase, partial [Pseudonocardiaceae bacterium]|nr:lantibiotic dehydratase [Pseudonocardiaceae bacterium]